MSSEEPAGRSEQAGFSIARALHAARSAILGPSPDPSDDLARVRRAVVEVSERLEHIEDRFQAYRLEMQNLTARVEDALEQATKRYARARASESRQKAADGEDQEPDPMRDPETYRAALARGGIGRF